MSARCDRSDRARDRLRRWQCLVAVWEDGFIRLVTGNGPLCNQGGKCRLVCILLKTSPTRVGLLCVSCTRGRAAKAPFRSSLHCVAALIMATVRTVASTTSN